MAEAVLRSLYHGILKIGDIELECHVLEDGRRIFSSRDLLKAFGLESSQKDQPRVLRTFLSRIKLISILENDLSNPVNKPIKFHRTGKGGLPANGYMAEFLPEICNAVLKLANNMMLSIEQRDAIERSRILLNAFAKIGIIALVDEATGYQEYRDKHALQEILDKYLRQEYAAWAKRFPDDFYKEMFRLKKWEWKGMNINRPGVVGKYTNNIVYARLAPGILSELQSKNPPDDSGHRKRRHHQWLTDDVGHPALSQHLHTVIAMMRGSSSWESFNRLLSKSFPVIGEQIELDYDEE